MYTATRAQVFFLVTFAALAAFVQLPKKRGRMWLKWMHSIILFGMTVLVVVSREGCHFTMLEPEWSPAPLAVECDAHWEQRRLYIGQSTHALVICVFISAIAHVVWCLTYPTCALWYNRKTKGFWERRKMMREQRALLKSLRESVVPTPETLTEVLQRRAAASTSEMESVAELNEDEMKAMREDMVNLHVMVGDLREECEKLKIEARDSKELARNYHDKYKEGYLGLKDKNRELMRENKELFDDL